MDRSPQARLGDLAVELSTCEGLLEVLTAIARHTVEALGYEDCVIYLVDSEMPSMLVQRAAWGPKSGEDGIAVQDPLRLAIGEGIVGACGQTRAPQRVDDTRLDPRHVDDTGSGRSELAVPILFRGQLLGVIDSEHPEPAFYTARDQAFISNIAALASAQVRAAMAIEQLADAARRDTLTGIGNRRAFDERLRQLAERPRVHGVAAIDVDGFKDVNDLYGHETGDHILQIVAEQLVQAFATDPSATVARLGGDEFGVISLATPRQTRARLMHAAELIDDATVGFGHVSASIGLACGSHDTLLQQADDAMIVAKRLGGSRVIDHASVLDRVAVLENERAWRSTLAEMLAADRFELAFQEIMRIDGGDEPMIFEALLRTPSLPGGTADLVGAAVKTGHDLEIDRWVLGRVLDVLQVNPAIVVAQNWSPRSFDQLGLVDFLERELGRRNVDPHRLVVEITEHAGIEQPARFADTIRAMRDLGVRVAIDDLGAGWSSFRLFDHAHVDIIKLDGSWVRQVHDNPVAREMIAATVRCARLLDVMVVAEWIETQADLDALVELGVEWGQGHHLGRPRPLSEVLETTRLRREV